MASGGGKSIRRYEGDSGEIHLVRIDDVTLALDDGSGPQVDQGTAATSPFWAKVSRGSTEYGLRPRTVGVCFTTTAPNNLEVGDTYDVVVLSKASFDAMTITGTVTYQGEAAQIVGKTDENIYPGI